MKRKVIDSFDGEFQFLSNFYPYTSKKGLEDGCEALKLHYDGLVFDSSEHAFQAAKSLRFEDRKKVQEAVSAYKSKRAGRKIQIRDDWDLVKKGVMSDVVCIKFRDLKLQKMLLETGDAYLIEGNYWHDNTWGDCSCDKCKKIVGRNWLGLILMEERDKIRELLHVFYSPHSSATESEKAFLVAAYFHCGQFYGSGEHKYPYSMHFTNVSMRCETSVAKITATLHDVIEDTELTLKDLELMKFSPEVIAAVECMTHRENESYEDYLVRAVSNPISKEVKLADVTENLSNTKSLKKERREKLEKKYAAALEFLKGE